VAESALSARLEATALLTVMSFQKENEFNEKFNKEKSLKGKGSVSFFFFSGPFPLICCLPSLPRESIRILKPGDFFIFGDPQEADGTDRKALKPILDRTHLPNMGSIHLYFELCKK